jgi:hypothetical protein
LERSPPLLKKPCFPFLFQRRIEKNPLSLKKILFVKVESYPSLSPHPKNSPFEERKNPPQFFPLFSKFHL